MICYTRCEKTVDSVTDTVLLHQLNSNYIKELVYETCKICTFNCIDRDIMNFFRLLRVNHSNGHIITHHVSRACAVLHIQRKKSIKTNTLLHCISSYNSNNIFPLCLLSTQAFWALAPNYFYHTYLLTLITASLQLRMFVIVLKPLWMMTFQDQMSFLKISKFLQILMDIQFQWMFTDQSKLEMLFYLRWFICKFLKHLNTIIPFF